MDFMLVWDKLYMHGGKLCMHDGKLCLHNIAYCACITAYCACMVASCAFRMTCWIHHGKLCIHDGDGFYNLEDITTWTKQHSAVLLLTHGHTINYMFVLPGD